MSELNPGTRYGLILGSGFVDDVPARADGVDNRFGMPSSPIVEQRIGLHDVLVLRRHGDGHSIPPHKINYLANLLALKEAGATAVVALNTVGVIGDDPLPGSLGVPDQIVDYTWGREHTIEDGSGSSVNHIDFTTPFTPELRERLLSAASGAGLACRDGGVYAVTQGPRLETAAEVDRLERDGADYIGMTGMPEASIAREFGLDYVCLALVVNRAAGRGHKSIHEDVESSTMSVRTQAMELLRYFFGAEMT